MNNTLVIYHKNCPDGFAAAWTAGYAVRGEFLKNVEFLQADYGDAIPDLTDRDVYIVDFAWPPGKLLAAARTAKHVTILDHHRTAYLDWQPVIHELPENVTVKIDLVESGASLTWKHFLPDRPVPYLLEVLKDYDLYTLALPETRDIVTGLRETVRNQDWLEFSSVVFSSPEDREMIQLRTEGRAINRHIRAEVEAILARNTKMQMFYGWLVPMANVPYEHRDLAGEILSKDHHFAVVYDDWHSKGIRKFSLRSTKGIGFDVETIAKRFKGGGHKHAAGFTLPLHAIAPAHDHIPFH